MAMWKITDIGPVQVSRTKLKKENILEQELEDWVVKDPALIGEPLLIVGRQVMIPDVKDRLDILALDPQGNAVVVELKRGELKDPVDMQALRYASYISKWQFKDFESQARLFLNRTGDPDFNFNEMYEKFCVGAGVDEVPDLNSDQRLVIVGSKVKDKLGSVALWLHDHNIDIKVVEVEVYRDGDAIFVQPQVIVPLPVSRFADTGRAPRGETSRPWVSDGKAWHLDKRCSPKTKEMLLELDDLIRDNFSVDGPRWSQKFYVAYRVGNYNWLTIHTYPSALKLKFLVEPGSFDKSQLAQCLNVEEFDEAESLADKLGLPSSVKIHNYSENADRIILRIKGEFTLGDATFLAFLREAYEAFPK